MDRYKANIPEIDQENEFLFKAATYLEMTGNDPGVSAEEFYEVLKDNNIDLAHEEFSRIATAAIAIETMLAMDDIDAEESGETIH